MRSALILCLVLLAACAAAPPPRPDPLLHDPGRTASAQELIIATPGALTSAGILLPLKAFETPQRPVVFYRLPGFDGVPARPGLDFDVAAGQIAALVAESGARRVYFVGFSMGNALNLEAAKRLRQTRPETEIRVAGISTALPSPQPVYAGMRGASGTIRAALRAGSLRRRDIWLEYYRTLLYGRNVDENLRDATQATRIVAERQDKIFVPTRAQGASHTLALINWKNERPERLEGVDIHLFHGSEDPVFPLRAVRRFAARLPQVTIHAYPGDGHLLLITRRGQLFQDIALRLGFAG